MPRLDIDEQEGVSKIANTIQDKIKITRKHRNCSSKHNWDCKKKFIIRYDYSTEQRNLNIRFHKTNDLIATDFLLVCLFWWFEFGFIQFGFLRAEIEFQNITTTGWHHFTTK
jgi:hypothetical protein